MRRTRELLRADSRTNFQIAVESGLPLHFVINLSSGHTADPSVNSVQKLYQFLAKKELELT